MASASLAKCVLITVYGYTPNIEVCSLEKGKPSRFKKLMIYVPEDVGMISKRDEPACMSRSLAKAHATFPGLYTRLVIYSTSSGTTRLL